MVNLDMYWLSSLLTLYLSPKTLILRVIKLSLIKSLEIQDFIIISISVYFGFFGSRSERHADGIHLESKASVQDTVFESRVFGVFFNPRLQPEDTLKYLHGAGGVGDQIEKIMGDWGGMILSTVLLTREK